MPDSMQVSLEAGLAWATKKLKWKKGVAWLEGV